MIGEFFIIKHRVKSRLEKVFNNGNDKILDLGCGENPHYHDSIKGDIVCLDIRNTSPAQVVSDANNPPFRNNSFDKIACINLIYYLKNPLDVISRLHGMIKKNGKLVIIVPFMYPIHDAPDDKYRFTEFGLREILQSKFKVLSIEPIGGFFTLPSVVLHSLIKGIPLLFPKRARTFIQAVSYILWPLYIASQLICILDVFDSTERWPVYYIAVAQRK